MAVLTFSRPCWTLMVVVVVVAAVIAAAFTFADQKNITAESGQNVTLPCRAPNNTIKVVEWSRADLEPEYVFVWRNKKYDPDNQHPSFKDRVDLQDRQMKDGDVSLTLKDVTINDTGTYECRVKTKTNRRKRANLNSDPICIINLSVAPPPGQPVGLVVAAVVVLLVAAAAVVGFVIYRRCTRKQSPTGGTTEDEEEEGDGGKGDGGTDEEIRGHYRILALLLASVVVIVVVASKVCPTYTKRDLKHLLNSALCVAKTNDQEVVERAASVTFLGQPQTV